MDLHIISYTVYIYIYIHPSLCQNKDEKFVVLLPLCCLLALTIVHTHTSHSVIIIAAPFSFLYVSIVEESRCVLVFCVHYFFFFAYAFGVVCVRAIRCVASVDL